MPEGHSVHRIARQFDLHFVGREVAASSPQGRFADGAEQLTGHTMVHSTAVGKQTFLEFDHGLWLRVHLGMYGAWDFAGDITADAAAAQAVGRSIGAPRRARLRMAEQERVVDEIEQFPPEPVGQVRVRLLTQETVADLRGPTACEVLTAEQVAHTIGTLGPDPLVDDPEAGEERFVAAVRRKQTPIGLLLMDQSVVSGIGNVYRAELLFRAKLNPHTPGKRLAPELIRQLWRDWTHLLTVGVQTGLMLTMEGLSEEAQRKAVASRDDRHWVYHREGLPCRVCGTNIVMEMAAARKLYWCPRCQA